MAHVERMKSEISCLEEIDIETASFADIVILIKNGLRKEEKSFARSCSISFSEVCFCSSAFPRDLGLHSKEGECLWQMQF